MGISPTQFDQMVLDHSSLLTYTGMSLCRDKHFVEDIVQDTWSSAWKSRALYRKNLGPTGAGAWLTRIMKRRVVDHWRKPDFPITVSDQRILEKAYFDEDIFQNEFNTTIQDALNKLPICLRKTFLLVIVDELTHREAANKLGVPLGTVLSRVSRAKRYLYKYLATSKK